MQSNKKSSTLQKVYVGIDVHLNQWDITCLTDTGYSKSFVQPPSAEALKSFLTRTFPGCEYLALYESGFTGFSTYYSLAKNGIKAAIIHAADVPTTQKEVLMKNDRRDSKKLAQTLRKGDFSPLYIRSPEDLDDRSLVRLMKTFSNEESKTKTRIKMHLYSHGISIPKELSGRFTKAQLDWIRNEAVFLGDSKQAITALLDHLERQHKETLSISRIVMRQVAASPKYQDQIRRLMTIPGVGIKLALNIVVEIGDFRRYPNQRAFASALGLVPTSHDSGPKVSRGEKIPRGNRHIGAMIIEGAWKFRQKDAAMNMFYYQCTKHMVPNKAIVKVARRLSNIIFSMMINSTDYDPSKTYK